MDDLDHSVLIAERDWDSFYEESEECSIQQAQLADLDDSGLSDTDDEKTSTQEPVLPLQTNCGKPNEEHDAAEPTLSVVDDSEVGHSSEDSECLSHQIDLEQTTQISVKDNTSTCACLTLDRGVHEDQRNNYASDTKILREHDQSQSPDKSSQAIEEPITASHAASLEGETLTKVVESSATPKKEKERWFVTVNDSPSQQKVYSGTPGQKKRRKKKPSRKSGHQARVRGGECPRSNSEKEAEGEKTKQVQKAQHDCKQPLQKCSKHLDLNALPSNVNEDLISDSANIKQEDLAPVTEPGEEDFQKSSVLNTYCTLATHLSAAEGECSAFSFKCKDAVDVPTENLENNPTASLNSQSSFILTHKSQLQANVLDSFITQLANDQSTVCLANEPESSIDITTQNQPMTNNISHDVHDDPKENDPSGELHQQQVYSTQSHNTEISSGQEECLETAVGPSRPIYALSSFWDEMEKLTINDILHLRVTNTPPLSGSVTPEESGVHLLQSKDSSLQDSNLVDDTTDSDYFTHLEDSKPDRSSCEFSTLSDFDDEFLQIINTSVNPSPEPQNIKEQTEFFCESNYVSELLPEQDLELTTSESEDIIMLCPEDGMPLYLYPATEAQGLYLTNTTENNESAFELDGIRKTPSPLVSVANTLDDQCLLSFSEIFDPDGLGLRTRTLDRCSPVVSFYSSKKLSVPEMYDDFFSDFVVGNLLFPSVQDQTVTVPIFSSSRSVVRDLVFPEVEELIEKDTEDDNSTIQVMTRFSNQPERSTSPTAKPNFYFYTGQRRNWSSFLSLRFIGKGSRWCQKFSSWIFPKEATTYVSRAQPQLFHMGDKISKREYFHFSVKQADMCLVCIAFASWVLKSYDPQSTDMWKAALLANVSAISAIQYLRKYVKKEATEDDS